MRYRWREQALSGGMAKFGVYLFLRLNFFGTGLFQVFGTRKPNELPRRKICGEEKSVMKERCRVLFVCMGNICRSPAAECIFRRFVKRAGLSEVIECDSAGTIDYHQGQPPDPRMRQAGDSRGFVIDGRARAAEEEDLASFDLILAMDRENLADLKSLDRQGWYGNKIRLFCRFASGFSEQEVPDPYYGGPAGFEQALDILEDGCEGVLNFVRSRLLVRG